MNALRYIFSPKMLVPAIAVAVTGALGFAIATQQPARAASNNDVVRGGYSNPTDLANKVNNSNELKTLLNHDFTAGYGIGDLNNWKANAKHATVYKDGRVVLDDGTVVATSANSLGREKFNAQRDPIKVGNTTYYYSSTKDSFAVDKLSAYVLMDPTDNSMKFAALTECANPVWGKTSAYKCSELQKTKVSDTTYKFKTTTYQNNANLTKLVYDFGDGKTQTVTSNFGQEVSHTYAPGKFTAKVTAYFNVNGKEKSHTQAKCTTPVEVPQPPKPVFVCESLTKLQNSRNKYTFTVKGKSSNATFVSAKFDFGDGQSAANLKGSNQTVNATHEYAKDGTYTVKAYLTYKEGTTAETKACVVSVTVNKETCADKPNAPECQPPKECKPGIPEGDKACEEECKPGVPKGDKACEEVPQVLPATGPAEIIGGALGLGSIAGAGMYYRNSRRNLISQILNR
jgi:PKD repeat protein